MARGDLTDAQWERLAPLLPPQHSGKRGHPYNDHRTVINGILWVDRTAAPWADLPERYGPHQTCYDRLVRWQRNGLWPQLLQTLQSQQDARSNVEWTGCAVDSTSIKAHPHAAGVRHQAAKGGHRSGRTKQTKRSRRLPHPSISRREKPSDAVVVA